MSQNYNNMQPAGVTPNPFDQVLDTEAYNMLTKCDSKLAVAILSIAVKKFSKDPEFIHYLKEEFKKDFKDKVSEDLQNNQETIPSSNSSIPSGSIPRNTTQTPTSAPVQNIPQNTNQQSSAVSVNW